MHALDDMALRMARPVGICIVVEPRSLVMQDDSGFLY